MQKFLLFAFFFCFQVRFCNAGLIIQSAKQVRLSQLKQIRVHLILKKVHHANHMCQIQILLAVLNALQDGGMNLWVRLHDANMRGIHKRHAKLSCICAALNQCALLVQGINHNHDCVKWCLHGRGKEGDAISNRNGRNGHLCLCAHNPNHVFQLSIFSMSFPCGNAPYFRSACLQHTTCH